MAAVVHYCYVRVPHFMAHSGYELVAMQANLAGSGRDVSIAGHGKRLPRHAFLRYPQAVIRRLSGLDEYSFGAAALEAKTSLQMTRTHGDIYHFLYGEHFCRFTPYLDGWRKNRVVATFHQAPFQLEERLRTTSHLRRLGAIIILGNNQRSFFERHAPAERIRFVPHGVDTSYFVPAATRPAHDEPLCVCIGGHLRDLDTLANAIRLIDRRGIKLRYEIIARHARAAVEGLPRTRVREYVSDDEMLRMYQEADVMVLPYKDVVASNVLLEGMACGAPLVVTDVGAVRDYLDPSAASFVRPRDAEELADAVLRLIHDTQLAAEQSHRARKLAEALDHALIAKRLAEVYASLG